MGAAQVGRNHACPCGSGRKFKQCCGAKRQSMSAGMRLTMIAVACAIIAGIALTVYSFTTEKDPAAGRVWSAEHGHYH